MSPSKHTYGPTCRLSHTATISNSTKDGDIPPLNSQFFYLSPLPIDDPLTAIPTPSGSESKSTKHDPRPFSAYDNNALEEAWLSLACEKDRRHHQKLKNNPLQPLIKAQADKRASIVRELPIKYNKKHGNEDLDKTSGKYDHVKKPPMEDRGRNRPKTACAACPSPSTKSSERSGSPVSHLMSSSSKILVHTTAGSTVPVLSGNTPKSDLSRSANTTNATKGAEVSERIEVGAAARPKLDTDGTLDNRNCEDPQHTALDLGLPLCCSDLERDVKSQQHTDTTGALGTGGSGDNLIQEALKQAEKQIGENRKGAEVDARYALNKHHGSDQGGATYETLRRQHESSTASIASVDKDTSSSVLKEHRVKEQKASEKHKQSKDQRRYKELLTADAAKQSTVFQQADSNQGVPFVSGSSETGTTGFPFKRAPSRKGNLSTRISSQSPSSRGNSANECDVCGNSDDDLDDSYREPLGTAEAVHIHRCKAHKKADDHASVPVGISRLHLVKLPALQMMPIYWSPVHDIAVVTRGTWFYKDTMYPVEPPLANQLEIGYRELRPWSRTWNDELNSAIEVGAAGEEKISHRIWPKETDKSNAKDGPEQISVGANPYCAARCFHGEVAAVGTVDSDQPGENSQTAQVTKRFPNSHVIYKDAQNAFMLKPNLQPSECYGRKPLAKIKKGIVVGVHVVRGFDWRAWEKRHSSKKSSTVVKAEEGAPVAGSANASKRPVCSACCEQDERPNVTDLVFVIHGIGQKLSERVESFHFTHAINAFRRSINVELGNDAVQNVCRKDLGGIMVLPVNWRSTLSFEDGGPMKDGDKSKEVGGSGFTLKDITPDTIPAIRNLISDVMLDIPFYMSHHKPKMIEALVAEANRVYWLWCQNNPKFQHEGRVHIIAHSLGSAMALDVLSKQPTSVGHVDLSKKKASTRHFEFNTKNLFFVGSPAGFFLLLNKGKLMPRKDRNKPGAQYGDDKEKHVVGEVGTFGCLAVDNLYNVMHYSDPIAYRLNGAVDPLYASTLKNAQVPNATIGWLESIGNVMRGIKPGTSTTAELGVGQLAKPVVTRLPSQLEMEVHDFSREEIAEKKFYLLNDNGQIDYFLSIGGGPLEIQYLNMLSAHSSYWGSPDFVRMVVTEVGRKPGRSNTLPNMKAVKIGHRKGVT
jgi:DDHD domain